MLGEFVTGRFFYVKNHQAIISDKALREIKHSLNHYQHNDYSTPNSYCNYCETKSKKLHFGGRDTNSFKICFDCATGLLPALNHNVTQIKVSKQRNDDNVDGDWNSFMKSFIGQNKAKNHADQLLAQSQLNQKRKSLGLDNRQFKLNAIFSGSPGTGKTSFAKALGKQLKNLNILSSGNLIVKTKADFVGRYIGETEEKTKNIVKHCKGSVLFIDEAYNLVSDDGSRQDFGFNAINTLMEEIDKLDNDIMVILAGYEKELYQIFETNPGYRRRFPHLIKFSDYSESELFEMFIVHSPSYNIDLTMDQISLIKKVINSNMSVKNFGNGGYITNLLEKISLNRDCRLHKSKKIEDINKQDLTTIELCDIPDFAQNIFSIDQKKTKLGF
jgi:stage V sporulation protein K